MREAVEFSAKHNITPHMTTFKLEEVPNMVELMNAHKAKGRMGVVFDWRRWPHEWKAQNLPSYKRCEMGVFPRYTLCSSKATEANPWRSRAGFRRLWSHAFDYKIFGYGSSLLSSITHFLLKYKEIEHIPMCLAFLRLLFTKKHDLATSCLLQNTNFSQHVPESGVLRLQITTLLFGSELDTKTKTLYADQTCAVLFGVRVLGPESNRLAFQTVLSRVPK